MKDILFDTLIDEATEELITSPKYLISLSEYQPSYEEIVDIINNMIENEPKIPTKDYIKTLETYKAQLENYNKFSGKKIKGY